MCAICGIVHSDSSARVERSLMETMASTMAHRGPDDHGLFVEGGVGLGHRRLSIIDLSGGKQPIFNEDRSAAIVFNGEIYNYRDLTSRLKASGHVFRTRTDTETILHAYEQYDLDCVRLLRGMFAFAIWDRARRRLMLARDRLGIKPLYYFANSTFFAFASEIKALLEIPGIVPEIDRDALDLYLALRYVPGPRTLFKNIFRLQPGHSLCLEGGRVRMVQYWDVDYETGEVKSEAEHAEDFRQLLAESVELRLISEVPLGVFLSGGLDSSAILAMMTARANESPVQTFSVGYHADGAEGKRFNELDYASMAAETFVAEHHECRLRPSDFETFLSDLVWYLDEPLADPSCVPLYFVARMASQHITVVLSGEGADEILGGYNIYQRMLLLERIRQWAPPSLIRLGSEWARFAPSEGLRNYAKMLRLPLASRYRGVCRGMTRDVTSRLIGERRIEELTALLDGIFGPYFTKAATASPINQMLYVDAKVWLPDDLLLKADKMTMANSVELRVPFLDHKLVEFAAALPDRLKVSGNRGKAALRTAMRGVLPDLIIDRPKKGFPTPVAPWLRSGLRNLAHEFLLAPDSACAGYMDSAEIGNLVRQHESGRADRHQELWTLMVFELWHRIFVDRRLVPSAARNMPLTATA